MNRYARGLRRASNVSRFVQVVVAALLAFSITVAVAWAAPPVPSFTFSPSDPVEGELVRFTSTSTDPDNDIESITWDLDTGSSFNDGSGPTATETYNCDDEEEDAPPCTMTARIRVEDDDDNVRIAVRSFTVRANQPPTASFTVSPESPLTNESITFNSTSTDPDGRPLFQRWDTDNDGSFDDGTGPQATRASGFPNDGHRTVRLQVIDSAGTVRTATRTITVRNRPPVASFTYTPSAPSSGDEVVLTSTSTDPDGEIEDFEWDLDEDGDFDDAEGSEARIAVDRPGDHQVGLRVTDDDDGESTAFDTIGAPQPPDPSPPGSGGGSGGPGGGTGNAVRGALIPFPSVRIRGMTTARGARIDLLSVRTPGGTRVLVRCRGRGCPYSRRIRRARFAESQVRTLRLPGFNRRHLRAGTVLKIFVIDDGVIGKYTRFDIRRGLRPPSRIDRCAVPGRFRVRSCPA